MLTLCRRLPLATAVLVAVFPLHAADTTAVGAPPTIALNQLAELLDAAPAAASCTAAVCRQSAVLVTDDRIDSLTRSGQLEAAAMAGTPVIVVNGDGDRDATARLARSLGVASRAAVSVHLSSPGEAKLHVFTLEELPEDPATRAVAVTNLLQQVSQWRPPTVRKRRSLQAFSDAPEVDVPRLELTVTAVSWVAGNLTTLEATVVRHVTATSSNVRVLMKSTHTLQPYEVIARPGVVRIPDVYRTMHAVVPSGRIQDASGIWTIGYVPPTLLGWVPQGSSSTSFDVSETHETTTGYSLSLSPEIGQSLSAAGVKTPLAKVGFSAGFQSSSTHSKSVSYRVEDYALSSAAIHQGLERWNTGFFEGLYEGPSRRLLEWRHSLASFIRNDRSYFFGSKVGNPASKITPAMRSLSPQHVSSWEVPEDAPYNMELSAGSRIDDVVSLDGYRVETQPSMAHVRASIFVSPQSAYLTREPTVLLRTQSGTGGCLTAVISDPDDWEYDAVKLLPCDAQRIEWELDAQWQLDNYQRYYNRGAEKCLTMQPTRGSQPAQLSLQTCTLASNQAWEWRADRLHSRYDGGAQGRLLLASAGGNVVAARSSVAVNPHHPLLVPWSNYPASPVMGSYIPSLAGPPQQVPPSWIGVPAVLPSARWDLTVLRRPSGG